MGNNLQIIKERAIEKVLKDILVLRDDVKNLNHKVTPGLTGFYGELLAWKQLRTFFGKRKQGYNVAFGVGASKADIVLHKGNRKVNIEVKTSRLKKEQPGMVYGFAINIKKCKLHPNASYIHPKKGKIKGDFHYFDYLLIVTLSEDLNNPKFYILPRTFLEKNEHSIRNRSKRFSSGSHRVIFIEKEKDPEEITRFDRNLTRNKKKYQNAWHLIKFL
ncbi:MAG: hypothetical protein A3A28_01025 [Candidatus Sungbacteria bacterium RIFCSPLOWO2_01_FULL_47_32]|uniref:Restriction endonuclease n=1 Tax=Candidatus Sungbacteria bacterium RIFCSPHIGHO2_01_FULL_47_32 TaxID=1802264 RepID=A0A1G2K958_9BACT|nr:MAG: hypothetical protein UX72_C0005G0021 [Parcubacteria group bacterium GW2011_GWA2_47_10]OGZ95915.1 MAG: hypothetical protein A2633_02420 [Candidatus Sungbacteria bacterium RIFCSPHIGHO2_01_FULL_47_32]OGZ98882.1 MAG: hypothetical protein A3D57_01805 [Candidatus Sungbacteria bacterium RIFCSPHIGHO2_02_FULL_46_12]OHA06175.1 MAG: hypothetical protein A3A28_01025 [Candidatus Sungbacteria bacterium RIFCSPLOWO2_01_FULL_47_32]